MLWPCHLLGMSLRTTWTSSHRSGNLYTGFMHCRHSMRPLHSSLFAARATQWLESVARTASFVGDLRLQAPSRCTEHKTLYCNPSRGCCAAYLARLTSGVQSERWKLQKARFLDLLWPKQACRACVNEETMQDLSG